MSPDSRTSLTMHGMWKATACAVAAFLAVGFTSVAPVAAQDATPEAAAECVAPAMDMAATPAAEMDIDMASPVAEEAAAEPVGSPADEATAAAIEAAVTNAIACINAGDGSIAALTTSNFRVATMGVDDMAGFAAAMTGTTFSDVTWWNPMTYEDGRVSADIQYMNSTSAYQINSERWFLAMDGDTWKLDGLTFIAPNIDLDSSVIGVVLGETTADDGSMSYTIAPNFPSAPENEALIFHVVNSGVEAHELVIVKLPDGADPAGLLDGSIGEDQIELIGVIAPLAAGAEADLTVAGLPAGVYTMICFFPGPDGMPHAANGMWVQFEVTAAA